MIHASVVRDALIQHVLQMHWEYLNHCSARRQKYLVHQARAVHADENARTRHQAHLLLKRRVVCQHHVLRVHVILGQNAHDLIQIIKVPGLVLGAIQQSHVSWGCWHILQWDVE